MEPRINISKNEPEAFKAMMGLETYIASTTLNPLHKELIKIRASQINGCAHCLNMHSTDARKLGETEQRIYMLNAWRETDLYTKEEQAILALTEEVTLISKGVSDATYQQAAKLFEEHYLSQIVMMIITINAWNRIGVTCGLHVS
jgi:AhpD family alkylhydroperoxidase